jgi:hypothetical protein
MASEITEKESPSDSEILNDIKTKPAVPVWPHYGWAHDACRGKSYQMARRGLAEGSPEFIRDGRMIRALTGPMRKKLHIEV